MTSERRSGFRLSHRQDDPGIQSHLRLSCRTELLWVGVRSAKRVVFACPARSAASGSPPLADRKRAIVFRATVAVNDLRPLRGALPSERVIDRARCPEIARPSDQRGDLAATTMTTCVLLPAIEAFVNIRGGGMAWAGSWPCEQSLYDIRQQPYTLRADFCAASLMPECCRRNTVC